MKNNFKSTVLWLLVLGLCVPFLAAIAGCGSSDNDPPNDPSYYKGEMKGKGSPTTAGGGAAPNPTG
ncbi:MAG TPA: hypothetical protein VJ835_12320 [Fimbriimonadaceae bacterium]|nr:hypothetical protein [Fimbriimonadaceae bacterium]